MNAKISLTCLLLSSVASVAVADVPKVVADIAPVHGLVARVMKGVGEPTLLIPAGASPHSYSLRPSDARALSTADNVFWVGEGLTPWLEGPIEELARSAHTIELLHSDVTTRLDFRDGSVFSEDDHEGHDHEEHADHAHEGHDHEEHADHAHEGHDHEEHADHAHEGNDHVERADHDHEGNDHEEHADHDHEGNDHEEHAGHDHHGHSHQGLDPHAWLSPSNAKAWLALIAEELVEHDPANAAIYQSNAIEGQAEIDAVVAHLKGDLSGVDGNFVVFHDAYQYFEAAFGLHSLGAISLGDASDPSAARIAEIQHAVEEAGVTCVFAEPQYNPGLIAAVTGDTKANSVVIDPLGTEVELGADFYPDLISKLGHDIAHCLGGK